MYIYPSTKVRPYVYFGVNPVTGEFYIGYRERNTKPSHIDLFEYRTSSAKVQPIFDQMTWAILAEFEVGDYAYDFEQWLIHENWGNPLLLNESCFYTKKRFKGTKGRTHSTESNIKRSASIKTNLPNSTFKKGHSPWNSGRVGVQNAWNKGIAATTVSCLYCKKEVDIRNFPRWHGNNCKQRVI